MTCTARLIEAMALLFSKNLRLLSILLCHLPFASISSGAGIAQSV
jgi:hypothetical protein